MANKRLQCRQLFWRNGWSTASERAGQAPTGQRRAGRGTTTATGSICRSSGRSRGSGLIPGPHPTFEVRFNATRLQSNLASPEVVPDSLRSGTRADDDPFQPSARRSSVAERRIRARPTSTPIRTWSPRAIAPPPGASGATTDTDRPHRRCVRQTSLPRHSSGRSTQRPLRFVVVDHTVRPSRPFRLARVPRPGMTNTDVRLGTHRP